jgi:hypothetical protein
MHAAIFWDAALMPVKCPMTYIIREADILNSLASLIFPWAGSPALRCGRIFFVEIAALLAFFLLFVVGLFTCAQESPEVAAGSAGSSSAPRVTKSSIADPVL